MTRQSRAAKRVFNPRASVSSAVLTGRILRLAQLGAPPGIIESCIDGVGRQRWIRKVIAEGREMYGSAVRCPHGVKYPSSTRWITRNERHRNEAAYLAALFLRNQQRYFKGKPAGPIERAIAKSSAYIATYESYLVEQGVAAGDALISFPRFWGLVRNLVGGNLELRRCSRQLCGAPFISFSGEGPRALCASCRLEMRMFCCDCHTVVELDRPFRLRQADAPVRCVDCENHREAPETVRTGQLHLYPAHMQLAPGGPRKFALAK